jgi:hypothetical protein
MKVSQISVFLENKAGRMAQVSRLLGSAGVNIRALSIADTTNFGILRLIVNESDKARQALEEGGYTVSLTDVVVVEIPDEPGGLAGVLEVLEDSGINVEYLYAFVEKATDKAVVVFRFEDTDAALKVLDRSGISTLTTDQVCTL